MTRAGAQDDGPAGRRRRKPAWHISSSRRPSWLWITASAIALACFTFGIVYAATSGKPGQAAARAGATTPASSASLQPGSTTGLQPGSTIGATTPAKGRAATAEPRSAAALGLDAGALALPGKLRAQAANWYAARGGTALAAVSGQVGAVTQAGSLRQYNEMKAACSALASDVSTAQADPPIPNAAMETLYAKALTTLATGAADCGKAISVQPDGDEQVVTQENPALLHQSSAEFQAGATYLFRATAEIEALSHR